MTASASEKATRNVALDVLRGLAILLVLLEHSPVSTKDAGWLSFLAPIIHFGWSGVDLFFVLSGFLVGGLLMNEIRKYGRIDAWRFIIRRGFKIWPAYYVFIGLDFLYHLRQEQNTVSSLLPAYQSSLLHYQNYFLSVWGTSRAHTWSLAIEEHFYTLAVLVLIPLVAWRRKAGSPLLKYLPALGLLIIVSCLLLRVHSALTVEPTMRYEYAKATHLRIDGLFFGVLLAYLHAFKPSLMEAIGRRTLLLFGAAIVLLGVVVPFPFGSFFTSTIGFTFLLLGYGALLMAVIHQKSGWMDRVLASVPARLLSFMGVYSYSIYLWHIFVLMIVGFWVAPRFPESMKFIGGNGVYIALSVMGGWLSAQVIEFPMLKVRNRMFPARSSAIVLPQFKAVSNTSTRDATADRATLAPASGGGL